MMDLTDKKLFEFFLKHYDKNRFLINKERKAKIKNLLKKIVENQKILDQKGKNGFIPEEQKNKIEYTQDLWDLLLREAIYCLREEDEADENEFRQDFGLIETRKYFKEFSQFEEVLYGTVKYYRDHSLHVIRVFLTGFYLLNKSKNFSFDSILIFWEDKLKGLKISEVEKQAIWTIIALTHDLGYPLQKIDEINNKIKGIIQYYGSSGIEEFKYHLPLQNQNLNDFILRFISSKLVVKEKSIEKCNNVEYFTVIQNKFYLKFAKAFEGFSHGIMSCILLMKHLVYFKESDYTHSALNGFSTERDSKQFLIRNSILRSIASHDNDDIYHIYPNTFLFLLAFCDELQEWDRPYLEIRFEPSNKIDIISFEKNEISYRQKYFSDSLKLTNNIIKYYGSSIKKYIKLFRSGPDAENRKFVFKFKLKLYNDKEETNDLIEFIYPPGDKPKIINLFDNQDHMDLILNIIDSNYREELINKFRKNINSTLEKKKKARTP